MNKIVLSVITSFAMDALKTLTHIAWESLWEVVFSSIADAEKQWSQSGDGVMKKSWAMDKIMAYLKTVKKFNRFQLWVINIMMSKIIDNIIISLNESFGNGWIKIAGNLKAVFENKIPFLK